MEIEFKSSIKELATGITVEVKLFLQQTVLGGEDAFIASIRNDKDKFADYCVGVESSSTKKSITKLNRVLEKQGYRLN